MDSEQIVKEYLQAQYSIKAYALSICGDYHIAEDICQEVIMTLIKKPEAYNDSRPFLPWVLSITRNKAVDYIKKLNKKTPLMFTDDITDLITEKYINVNKEYKIESRVIALRSCLQNLNEENYKIIKAKYVDKLPVKEMSIKFNRSFLSIQSLLDRLRDKMKNCIKSKMEVPNEI